MTNDKLLVSAETISKKENFRYICINFSNGEYDEIEVDGDWDIKIVVDYDRRAILHVFSDGSKTIYPFENITSFNPAYKIKEELN